MKNTKSKSPARQAALITALILGSGGWVSAQTNQGRANPGQYNPDQSTGQYNQGQYNEGQPGHPGIQMDRQPAAINADRSINNQALPLTKINKGSSLIGATVKNQQGENLGKVRDLVIDFDSDRVAYLVLGADSGAFSSEKMHAVPLRAFQPDATGTSLILNADKAKLEASAGFDKDNWPATATGVWGAEPFWKDDTRRTPNWPERKTDKWNTGNETNRVNKVIR